MGWIEAQGRFESIYLIWVGAYFCLKPTRGQRGHQVTLLGKLWNQMVSKERILVEHMLCKLEKFKILAGTYRANNSGYDDCFTVVAGLVNFKSMGKLA